MNSPRLRDSKDGMRNLKLILSYDGSEFFGWQVQPNLPTIQAVLASAIGRITGEKVLPQGSGRTDAGVHALGSGGDICYGVLSADSQFRQSSE